MFSNDSLDSGNKVDRGSRWDDAKECGGGEGMAVGGARGRWLEGTSYKEKKIHKTCVTNYNIPILLIYTNILIVSCNKSVL